MKNVYIGVPLKDGCHVDGADKGISVINDNYKLNKILNIQKYDKDIETVINACESLASNVYNSLCDGDFPISIGGDHSLAIGSIAGSSKYNDNLGVIWFDTHPDINTIDTTVTYHIHGYPLAASMGFGQDNLTKLFFDKTKVKHENVVLFGINDIDIPEQELIDRYNIKCYTLDDINKLGYEKCVNDAIKYLNSKTDRIHLSFDIDSINPFECPGVSVPNNYNKGLNKKDALYSIERFLKELNIVSMDVVEYNPLNDINNKSLNIVIETINLINANKK